MMTFNEIYKTYGRKYKVLIKENLTNTDVTYSEAFNDVMTQIYIALKRYNHKYSLINYLDTVVKNKIKDINRTTKKIETTSLDEIIDTYGYEPEFEVDGLKDSDMLLSLIKDRLKLRPLDYKIFTMYFIDGFLCKEMSETLGKSANVLKTKTCRIRNKVDKILELS